MKTLLKKGEIAGCQHFFQFPQCFQNTTLTRWLRVGIIWLKLYQTIPLLTTLRKKPFKSIVGKGENAGKQHFLLFPQCFLSVPKQCLILKSHLICSLQSLSNWTSLKFFAWLRVLTISQTTNFRLFQSEGVCRRQF